MIKANELRIGNLVLDSNKNTHRIERLDERWDFSDRFPIPLTEEWLFNFGFTKLESDLNIEYKIRLHEDFYFMINFDKNSESYESGYYEFDHEIGSMVFDNFTNGVHEVHQLQNLFYCLCDQELELK